MCDLHLSWRAGPLFWYCWLILSDYIHEVQFDSCFIIIYLIFIIFLCSIFCSKLDKLLLISVAFCWFLLLSWGSCTYIHSIDVRFNPPISIGPFILCFRHFCTSFIDSLVVFSGPKMLYVFLFLVSSAASVKPRPLVEPKMLVEWK